MRYSLGPGRVIYDGKKPIAYLGRVPVAGTFTISPSELHELARYIVRALNDLEMQENW